MDFEQARFNMVEQQIRPANVLDFDVLDALLAIPRENFVSEAQKALAYADVELPLGNGGAMFRPIIIARMVQALAIKSTDDVLEIGTGSGYVTAILSQLAQTVVTADTDEKQQAQAKVALGRLGYQNITYKVGDGFFCAQEDSPFDVIYVGGACPQLPQTLKNQLRVETGRIAIIEGEAPAMKVNLYTFSSGELIAKTVFETHAPYLDKRTIKEVFHF